MMLPDAEYIYPIADFDGRIPGPRGCPATVSDQLSLSPKCIREAAPLCALTTIFLQARPWMPS